MSTRAVTNTCRRISRINQHGYLEVIWFVGGGPLPKGWRRYRGP